MMFAGRLFAACLFAGRLLVGHLHTIFCAKLNLWLIKFLRVKMHLNLILNIHIKVFQK